MFLNDLSLSLNQGDFMTTIQRAVPAVIQNAIRASLTTAVKNEGVSDEELNTFFGWLDRIIKQDPPMRTDINDLLPDPIKGKFVAFQQKSLEDDVVSTLIKFIEDKRNDLIPKAIELLEVLANGNKDAIKALTKLLSSDWVIPAAKALGTIDEGNKDAIKALTEQLKAPDPETYLLILVAEALGTIDPGNKEAIDTLTTELNIRIPERIYNAAKALGRIDPGNTRARSELTQLLYDRDKSIVCKAAITLSKLDLGNLDAIEALKELLNHPNLDYAGAAAKALSSIFGYT